MKLFKIPAPWDWHEFGAVFVIAEDAEAAKAKVRADLARTDGGVLGYHDAKGRWHPSEEMRQQIRWLEIEEIESGVADGAGCDD